MPSKNAIKEYEAGAYYHIYNRGVEKRLIFLDDQDYKTFLSYLKFYLTIPKPEIIQSLQGVSLKAIPPSRISRNYQGEIILLAYCLMPNHFHLLVRQNSDSAINFFMRSLATKYVRYFNTRYNRIGHLFQDTYKAVKIETENQWIHLSKYIHRNPLDLPTYKESPCRLSDFNYSSYPNYLGLYQQSWINPQEILSCFGRNPSASYEKFVTEDQDITPIYFSALDYE